MVVVFNHMIIIHDSFLIFLYKEYARDLNHRVAMNKFRIINMSLDVILILITKYIYYLDNIYKCNVLMIL